MTLIKGIWKVAIIENSNLSINEKIISIKEICKNIKISKIL